MNDIKQVVPNLNFNNKARAVLLTIGKFDSGFVVRDVLGKKTIGLASLGDIVGLTAQIADVLAGNIQEMLKNNRAIALQIQLQDGQIGVIPIGFDKITDATMMQKLMYSLAPFFNSRNFAAPSNPGFKDYSYIDNSKGNDDDDKKPLVFDPEMMFNTLGGFNNPFGGGNPFMIIEDDEVDEDSPQVIHSTQAQKPRYSNKPDAQVKETRDGKSTRLEV